MKKIFFLIGLFLLPLLMQAQTIKDVDFIAPILDGYAAVKKGNQWAFMNAQGNIVIDFRDDLVANEKGIAGIDLGVSSQSYPLMLENRSIIKTMKDGIAYYGFINSIGKIAIPPIYLNVTNFKNGYALALHLNEIVLGSNAPLGKRVVTYEYNVVLMDTNGNIIKYVTGPFPISLSKEKLKVAPPIFAKDISENLIAVRTPNGKWEVIKIK
ncbi:MAG: hypothetical protein COZ75_01475 [Flavobacteriaceae bacterium CG_4_8_14_3_um_filter_34_10]|nr:MAG: hypothetical protein AUK33_09290 [Flavobacteriaceae bacterium CG2_30_34_30]PIQ18911.1 MAG: hypothetical protein COW66_03895 [Flavobacteriaceae bacterium CG18_big_fil_WC_8_21_14_2_50_34_36]PIV48964.1 MAG: hypothetical protein COS19_11075 [Flavobacteriaceae bacterium CG02_land_8_20_14_3_00_34_13]PIX10469.1 MAG: hypothetical protein COZ75_01475 [Flavobacteriaceae bacterium CG_4_8_14_3_um_filter_34_10]PIZ08632.1 MAG: hypothetical protein COY56_02885 [Flavobacteriaceae bacterium CG_4_10_14_0